MTNQELSNLIKDLVYNVKGYRHNVDLDNEIRAGLHQENIKAILEEIYYT